MMFELALLAWMTMGVTGHLLWVRKFNADSRARNMPDHIIGPVEASVMGVLAGFVGPFTFIGTGR